LDKDRRFGVVPKTLEPSPTVVCHETELLPDARDQCRQIER
jgi:hypothetical protein